MPELRGVQATPEVKEEWKRAYKFYLAAPGDPYDAKKDRTERINYVAEKMDLTRKQAKRRVRNYEAWQRNVKKNLVPIDATQDGAPPVAPKPKPPHQDRGQRGAAPPRGPYTR